MKIQEGHLSKKSGAWLGHYAKWVMDARTGAKRRQQKAFRIGPLATTTLTAAKEALRERIVEELGLTADSRTTFGAFMEHRWKPLREGQWRESTRQTNEELMAVLDARFGKEAIEDVDSVQLQAWLNDLAKRRSGSMVKHCRIFLKSILAEAVEQGYVRKDAARLLRVPRVRPVLRPYLTEKEIKELLKKAKWQPREYAVLCLVLVTGLRPSELFALRWKNVSADYTTLTLQDTVYRGKLRPFTKTTEQGDTQFVTAFIPGAVSDSLMKWHAKTDRNGAGDFVFPNSEGGYWWKENYQRRVLDPLAHLAGVQRFNFQMLRRSVATHAQSLGSPKDIAAILRHRKTETAQENYVQQVDASVKAATEKLAAALLK